MKNTKYEIFFFNDAQIYVFAGSFPDAIILGMARAIENAWDKRIKYVRDEKGKTIKNITFSTFEFEN